MKILHLSIGLGIGGAEKVMSDLVLNMSRNGHKVEILGLKSHGVVSDYLKGSDIKVTALGCSGIWDLRVFNRAYKFIKNGNFDIIHSHCLWAGVIACLFKGRAKVVWHEHMANDRLSFFRSLIEYFFILMSDAVIVPCESVSGCVLSRNPLIAGRVKIIRNGVSADFSPRPERPTKVFGFVGRMDDPVKGYKVFKKAAEIARSKRPDLEFIVINGRPRFEVEKAYGFMDVLVVPSLADGLPLVILEGMMRRLPVIASDVGGIYEAIKDGENGLLVPPNSPLALAEAILKISNYTFWAKSMGENGWNKAMESFGIEDMVQSVESVYAGLFKRGSLMTVLAVA